MGTALGGHQAAQARALARRITVIGGVGGAACALLVGAGAGVLPRLFSPDPQVHTQAMLAWPWFVAMLSAAGMVFALDGVLIGAGDIRYLRNLTLAVALGGIWAGLTLFIAIRLAIQLARIRPGGWIVLGAVR